MGPISHMRGLVQMRTKENKGQKKVDNWDLRVHRKKFKAHTECTYVYSLFDFNIEHSYWIEQEDQ